eukprot:SAG11_NODE_4688_length_1806_cov_1.173989_1_plen_226_part_00
MGAAAAMLSAAGCSSLLLATHQPPINAASADRSATSNRVLGDGRHRVGLCGWPVKSAVAANDPRVATPRKLFGWVRECGYEGVELTTEDFKAMYYQSGATPGATVVREIRAAAAAAGVTRVSTGGLYHVTDGGPSPYGTSGRPVLDFNQVGFEQAVRTTLREDIELGSEYANFQIHLSERYLNTGGEYRRDEAYLSLCADRIATLQVRFECVVAIVPYGGHMICG